MHTYKYNSTIFQYNYLEGAVDNDFVCITSVDDDGKVLGTINIPATALLNFVAFEYILPKRISALKNSSAEELLRKTS